MKNYPFSEVLISVRNKSNFNSRLAFSKKNNISIDMITKYEDDKFIPLKKDLPEIAKLYGVDLDGLTNQWKISKIQLQKEALEKLGVMLRKKRKANKITIIEIAKLINCARATIWNWENKIFKPQTKFLPKISKHYEIDIKNINDILNIYFPFKFLKEKTTTIIVDSSEKTQKATEEREVLVSKARAIGELLSDARHELGYSRESIAEEIEVNSDEIFGWEHDTLKPDHKLIPKISEVYQVEEMEIINLLKSEIIPKSPKVQKKQDEPTAKIVEETTTKAKKIPKKKVEEVKKSKDDILPLMRNTIESDITELSQEQFEFLVNIEKYLSKPMPPETIKSLLGCK